MYDSEQNILSFQYDYILLILISIESYLQFDATSAKSIKIFQLCFCRSEKI